MANPYQKVSAASMASESLAGNPRPSLAPRKSSYAVDSASNAIATAPPASPGGGSTNYADLKRSRMEGMLSPTGTRKSYFEAARDHGEGYSTSTPDQ
ncbi:hypothetical protein G7K_0357-t1 [Saitoella complicata NRRL Y-17804]|uniref:Uncharacterized protein n=1 Tax=Saitoella complicata (strain BCRC 22490 / CBS 7301 / JCM 7358 / NBRC 10748 / NRRL Y-17804) TaxID=698492 RepID=A0A0E9N880_SAICN|nr:hypothetical protein G7K_0357-t1 [Saitoella complicata NRRL Y-17804]